MSYNYQVFHLISNLISYFNGIDTFRCSRGDLSGPFRTFGIYFSPNAVIACILHTFWTTGNSTNRLYPYHSRLKAKISSNYLFVVSYWCHCAALKICWCAKRSPIPLFLFPWQCEKCRHKNITIRKMSIRKNLREK